MSLSKTYKFLIDPKLPTKILALLGAIATLVVITGIGVWSIVGACKAFGILVSLE